MLFFWKQRLAMLSVPKTGTTAYEAALAPYADWTFSNPPALKHMPLHTYRNRVEPIAEMAGAKNIGIFVTIRSPVDWLGSWYRYRSREDLIGTPYSTRGVSFDDFVAEYISKRPKAFAAVGAQAAYMFNPDGSVAAKHAFKYENQAEIHAFWQRRLKVTLELPRLNPSPKVALELDQDIEAALHFAKPLEYEAWARAR